MIRKKSPIFVEIKNLRFLWKIIVQIELNRFFHDFCYVPFRFFRSFSAVWQCAFRKLHAHHHELFIKQELVHSLHYASSIPFVHKPMLFTKKTALQAKIAPNLPFLGQHLRKFVRFDNLSKNKERQLSEKFRNYRDFRK